MAESKSPTTFAAIDDPLEGEKLEDTVGYCVSGGGYKAALFHLGGLVRINELGRLRQIARISSVSGGSITSGMLAAKWSMLSFNAAGVATNFTAIVLKPLVKFCREADIDVGSVIDGIFNPFERAADNVEEAYAKGLYGAARLADLPQETPGVAPRFVFNATNVQLNSLVRFSRDYVADWRIGEWRAPDLPLAKVVAASSAFPPVLSPVIVKPPRPFEPLPGADRSHAPYNSRLELCDGGVYDNLGVETVWKRCKTILVSNAGDPFAEHDNPKDDWLAQLQRTVSMIHRQAENNRMRTLILLAKGKHRKVALWNLRAFGGPSSLDPTDKFGSVARNVKVRLKSLRSTEATALLHHGYVMADAAITNFWPPAAPKATKFPAELMA